MPLEKDEFVRAWRNSTAKPGGFLMTDYKEGDIFRLVREELTGNANELFTHPSVNQHIANVGRQLYALY